MRAGNEYPVLRARIPPYLAGAQISATALAKIWGALINILSPGLSSAFVGTHTHPHTNTHRRRHRNRHRHTQTMDKKRVTKPKKRFKKQNFQIF